ncbi:MAG: SDR family NAD(P)-dependent oxidoreductase [Candidatus Heimdallarchaeota archaeon]
MDHKFLQGKGCLITGGASGFGRAVAYSFAEHGADLVLVDVNEELLEETSHNIKMKTGSKIAPITCDVSDSKQVKQMTNQSFNELENIFILFNNAGIATTYGVDLIKVGEKAWDKTMNINLKGQWLLDKFVCRKMNRQSFEPLRGKVIHTASHYGIALNPLNPLYSLSKAGVIALTKLLAKTVAPYISSNAIAPNHRVTGFYANREDILKQVINDSNEKIPLNRIGTLEDVVDIILFLASSDSDFITGHCFIIDGGTTEVGVHPNILKSKI